MRRLTVSVAIATTLAAVGPASAKVTTTNLAGFMVEHEVVLPGSPEDIYDTVTGDIKPWWDHHMSESPRSLTIDARPGGLFIEVFDESGDGALHATVIYAQRGKRLRFAGPLGFSGHPLELVVTYDLEPHEKGTLLKVTCSAAGQFEKGWDQAIDQVWHHFLFEALKPYVESRASEE
jgi:hypothetical protein